MEKYLNYSSKELAICLKSEDVDRFIIFATFICLCPVKLTHSLKIMYNL
jgi:hypothetical protein